MTHVFIVYQKDMDDGDRKEVVGVYTSLAVAREAIVRLWADDEWAREVYGEDNNPFTVEGWVLTTSLGE